MRNYLDLCDRVLTYGEHKDDRTGTGTLSLFSTQLSFDLQEGFPAVTCKKLWLPGVFHELLWMISGSQNIKYMQDHGVKIWDEWADKDGNLGPVYGSQWRHWPKFIWDGGGYVLDEEWDDDTRSYRDGRIDQLSQVIHTIKTRPADRRMIVSAWNVGELDQMALPPCHMMFQFYVRGGAYLHCQVYQRSADMFLGVPFDIASYATLVTMIAHLTDLKPGVLSMLFGDTHIYLNHVDQVKLMLTRETKRLPILEVNYGNREIATIDDFRFEDFKVLGYDPHPAIKGAVSV